MRLGRWLCLILAALLGLGALLPAAAHDARPLHIDIDEVAAGTFKLRWQAPASLDPGDAPTVGLAPPCRLLSGAATGDLSGLAVYDCEKVEGQPAAEILYPGANPSLSTLLRLTRLDGASHTALLGPGERSWRLPAAETPSRVAASYTWLGIRHIWEGLDHLLFLVCLLFIAGTWRRVLVTVLGFTLAHSLTLCLAALGLLVLPAPPVEAVIALSILFLASEIAAGPSASLTWRHPVAVSSAFGLVHGLGFASVLAEIGLPQTQLALGLLFFNVGVEIGQCLFIAAIFLSLPAGTRLRVDAESGARRQLRVAAAYGVGALAAYWLIARVSGFFA